MTTASAFHDAFQSFVKDVSNCINLLAAKRDERSLEKVSHLIATQQRLLNEAANALPAYDIRRYQLSIDQFSNSLQNIKDQQLPKANFSFKSKRPGTSATKDIKASSTSLAQPASTSTIRTTEVPGALLISSLSDGSKEINADSHPAILTSSTLSIHSLVDCKIDVSRPSPYTSITLRNLDSCVVSGAICSSSLFIDSCKSCKIIGTAQQFRIHSSESCEIKYHCLAGRPVIEDCRQMSFLNMGSDEKGGKAVTAVDDFSDLSGSRRNWSIIEDR